ncbi:MAG: hypothetical protein ACRD1R_11935 [Acidobacteriota bacterium]
MNRNYYKALFLSALLLLSLVHCGTDAGTDPATREGVLEPEAGSPEASLTFAPPEEWSEQNPGPMRRAQYQLASGEPGVEDAEVAVFFFQGGGGGTIQANLDRWTGQFTTDGAPTETKGEVSKSEVNGLPLTILDISGTYRPAMGMMSTGEPRPNYRMIAAIVETQAGPWFFRLTGPEATVGRWEESFRSFLQTVKPVEV